MSLSLHIILLVTALVGLIGFLYLAKIFKNSFEIAVNMDEKIGVFQAAALVKEESAMIYEPIVSMPITRMTAFWDAHDWQVIISGPARSISKPLLRHEIGHGRVYQRRATQGKKFMAINTSKSWLMIKIATMSFYEYFTEKEAWVASQYGTKGVVSSLQLRYYAIRALVSIFDTMTLVLILSLIIRWIL